MTLQVEDLKYLWGAQISKSLLVGNGLGKWGIARDTPLTRRDNWHLHHLLSKHQTPKPPLDFIFPDSMTELFKSDIDQQAKGGKRYAPYASVWSFVERMIAYHRNHSPVDIKDLAAGYLQAAHNLYSAIGQIERTHIIPVETIDQNRCAEHYFMFELARAYLLRKKETNATNTEVVRDIDEQLDALEPHIEVYNLYSRKIDLKDKINKLSRSAADDMNSQNISRMQELTSAHENVNAALDFRVKSLQLKYELAEAETEKAHWVTEIERRRAALAEHQVKQAPQSPGLPSLGRGPTLQIQR